MHHNYFTAVYKLIKHLNASTFVSRSETYRTRSERKFTSKRTERSLEPWSLPYVYAVMIVCGSIFIQIYTVGSHLYGNKVRIGRSSSSKVRDFGTYRKCMQFPITPP